MSSGFYACPRMGWVPPPTPSTLSKPLKPPQPSKASHGITTNPLMISAQTPSWCHQEPPHQELPHDVTMSPHSWCHHELQPTPPCTCTHPLSPSKGLPPLWPTCTCGVIVTSLWQHHFSNFYWWPYSINWNVGSFGTLYTLQNSELILELF